MAAKRRKRGEVRPIMVRMGADYVACLDELCDINKRSRREVIEILVDQAHLAWTRKNDVRVNPV